MIPARHRISEADFIALSRCGGGPRVMRTLVSARRSRTLLLLRFIVGLANDETARQAYRVLAGVGRIAPAAVERVLDHPGVGAWATGTALRLNRGSPASPAELAWIALAAAIRGGVPAEVVIPPRARISLPTLGVAACGNRDPVTAYVRPDGADLGGRVHVPAAWRSIAPGWHPVPEIVLEHDGCRATFLLDPCTFGGLPADLTVHADIDLAVWRTRIAEGWKLLVTNHREVAEEVAATLSVLAPLRVPDGGMSSCTVADAFGCLFLSLPPDARSVGLTFAHELQHAKLVALMDLFPLLESATGELYYAPWRDDPRPLAGLLHGTYAFAGITGFWHRQRARERSRSDRHHADVEFARWRTNALTAARTLVRGSRLTALGHTFATGMIDVLERYCAEPVQDRALARANHLSAAHRTRWQAAHPALG